MAIVKFCYLQAPLNIFKAMSSVIAFYADSWKWQLFAPEFMLSHATALHRRAAASTTPGAQLLTAIW